MCSNHATVRGVLKEIPADLGTVVVDLEASPEHLTRGTTRHLDQMLIVAEPYFKSLETARRYHLLAVDLGIPKVSIVANKVRQGDEEAVGDYCRQHGFELLATIPFDARLAEAERLGRAPVDHLQQGGALEAIEHLAHKLRTSEP